MAMQAGTFFAHFNQIKIYVQKYPDASDEIKSGFRSLAEAFKAAYTPQDFKQALATNAEVSSDLEERVTSTLILIKRESVHRTSG
jgi:hypothetical protein